MNEKEGATDMSVLYALLMRVSRAFFNTQQIVVLDQLMRQEEISDENLAKNVGLTVKEIHRLCGTLKEACLIKTCFSLMGSHKISIRRLVLMSFRDHVILPIRDRVEDAFNKLFHDFDSGIPVTDTAA
ncbi:3185_t:CDS:2, partial [Entrophospora sp. SA101]